MNAECNSSSFATIHLIPFISSKQQYVHSQKKKMKQKRENEKEIKIPM